MKRISSCASSAVIDLYSALATGQDESAAAQLDENPALANSFAMDGFTPLCLVAFFGHLSTCQLLLARGAPWYMILLSRWEMPLKPSPIMVSRSIYPSSKNPCPFLFAWRCSSPPTATWCRASCPSCARCTEPPPGIGNQARSLILRRVSDVVGTDGCEAYGQIELFARNTRQMMDELVASLREWRDRCKG